MAVLLKCAACGAEVEFADDKPSTESECLGCEVKVRRRPGDEEMAIPVSMELPDEFHHVNLDQVAKHSDLLVERYRKPAAVPPNPTADKDAIMAQALASLANAVARLEDRLEPAEPQAPGAESPEPAAPIYPRTGKENLKRSESNGIRVADEDSEPIANPSAEDVVQLSEHDHGAKAIPLEARLLVRREAAAEAHRYERKSQSAYDHRGREHVKTNWFSSLMERRPVLTVICTLVPTLALVGYVIYWMYMDSLLTSTNTEVDKPLEKGGMAQRWEDDPAAATAELVARMFLMAPSAKEARDVIYQYEQISEKFDTLFRPVENPGDYELTPKGQQVMPDGTKIYAFRVFSKGEEPRTLVVLPEGKMPKVHWEFFAEVGDMSWSEFMTQQPSKPVMLRAFVQKSDKYFGPYLPDEWQSYVLHDRDQDHVLMAYAKRTSGESWILDHQLKTDPVKIGRLFGVRAQVEVSFSVEVEQSQGSRVFLAEITDVVSTNWLPDRFVEKPEP